MHKFETKRTKFIVLFPRLFHRWSAVVERFPLLSSPRPFHRNSCGSAPEATAPSAPARSSSISASTHLNAKQEHVKKAVSITLGPPSALDASNLPLRKRSDPVLSLRDRPQKSSMKVRSDSEELPVSPIHFTITSNPMGYKRTSTFSDTESEPSFISQSARPIQELSFADDSSSRKSRKCALISCMKSPTFDDMDDSSSEEERLFFVDEVLEHAQKNIMARTAQRYLILDHISYADKVFTAMLIVLTMIVILVLFWYQNFGPGFKFKHIRQ